MAKAADPMRDMIRDRTTHGSAGRVNVERGKDGTINLRLAQWAISPDCWLERGEALKLIDRIKEALAPPKTKVAVVEEFDPEEFT